VSKRNNVMLPLYLTNDDRDCQHIHSAKSDAEQNCPAFLDGNVDEENISNLLTAKFTTQSTQAVSYKPIPPPTWLVLPGEQLLEQPFHAPDLPQLFSLDPTSRCSCGSNRWQGINSMVDEIVIFTNCTAIIRQIETVYCTLCTNKRGRVGPDLSEFGIFNWNNRIAFSHQLMNEYTNRFTTALTPFFSFREQIINLYESQRSPRSFVSLYIFIAAYFRFVQIQQLETEMRCLHCKDEPSVVIADGVSISFSNTKVLGLKPPTICDKEKELVKINAPRNQSRTTCFEGEPKIRREFQNALELTKYEDVCSKLKALILQHQVISTCVKG